MILRIGHRGAMGYEPENTLRSFRRALDLGCHMVELDVHRCRTGELVVIHDDTLERTTSGTGPVREKSLEELRMLDAGKGEKIPLLEEVLDEIGGRARVNIELKGYGTARPLAHLIERLRREQGWKDESLLVSSFDHEELSAFRKLDPLTPVGILFKELPAGLFDFAFQLSACSFNPLFRIVDAGFVERSHREGFQVFVWTVNEPGDIDRMKALQVDGICSNYPDRI
jgi:glycerophosphoryl diester phosphodiesterase